MHMAIAGVAGYYYFAPWGDSADWAMPVTMREHILLHDTLEELDAVLGCRSSSWVVDTKIRWEDDVILSGVTGARSRVWRLTPARPWAALTLALDFFPGGAARLEADGAVDVVGDGAGDLCVDPARGGQTMTYTDLVQNRC